MPTSTSKTRFPGVYAREGKRRHNGKPDVCFYYTVTQGGKKTWIKAGWKSEGMTAAVAAEMRAAKQTEARRTPGLEIRRNSRLTFDAAAEHYTAHRACSQASKATAASIIRKRLIPAFGGMLLAQVDAASIRSLIDKTLADGHSTSHAAAILDTLSGIFTLTARDGLHTLDNPCRQVTKPRLRNERLRFLSKDEAAALLDALAKRSRDWHDLAALSLWTGARLGELLTLSAGSVDIANGIATVTGKTGRRVIHLNAAARSLLTQRIAEHPGMIFPAQKSNTKSGHLSPYHALFTAAVQECGLNPPGTPREMLVVFHTLRHTFASWLAIAGVPLYTISQLMGHASMQMTQRYAHLCPDTKRDAVEKLTDPA